MYRRVPSILQVLMIIRPETLVRWHRSGFRRYWRWKSRRMSIDNPLWGTPRIHGELLNLGFELVQSSVAKYLVTRHQNHRHPFPSQ
jgi:hypothetical protein